METAIISEIHRNSLEDGPGIRTTIFLKGCPLHCQWCHNPELISREKELAFFSEKCSLCGSCVDSGANIELRCPLIPGINDDEKHLHELSLIKKKYPELVRLRIMPYHNSGNIKYRRYGYDNSLTGLNTADEETIRKWNSCLNG